MGGGAHSLVTSKVLIEIILLAVRGRVVSRDIFSIPYSFIASSTVVDGSAGLFHVVPGHWIASSGFRSTGEAHNARLDRCLGQPSSVLIVGHILLLELLNVAQLVLLRCFEARAEFVPNILLREVCVRRHGSVQSSCEITAFVEIFITHDLPILVVQMFSHAEHPCMRASARRSGPGLVKVVDEMRLAPRVRSWDTRHQVLVQKLQIVYVSRFPICLRLLTRKREVVVRLAAHTLVENVDVEVDSSCKLIRFRSLVRIAEASDVQLRISQVGRVV